jgi:hypothetical protein
MKTQHSLEINPSWHFGQEMKKNVSLVELMVTKPQLTGETHAHPNCRNLLLV